MQFKIKNNKGFTIIELMIGVTIGLLTLLVIANTVVATDKQKKQTASINDAQSGGQLSSYYLNRDIRMAGYGLTQSNFSGCTLRGINPGAFSFDLQPASIVAGASADESDELTVFYSNAETTSTLTKLMANYNGTDNFYRVDNRYGFMAGDLAIAYSASKDINSDGVPDCRLVEITSIPSALPQKDYINFTTGNYLNKRRGQTVTARYNAAAGTGVTYNTGTRLINLGDSPTSATYKVEDSQLKRIDNFTGEELVLADNVALFKAYYIKDTDNNFSADVIDQTDPGVSNWRSVVGIRFSVVTKSVTRDEDPFSEITVVPATQLSATVSAPVVKTLSGDDRYYRYKTFSAIVPLRNVLWRE